MNHSWNIVEQYASVLKGKHLKELFIEDASRAEQFSFSNDIAFVDFSRQRIDQHLMSALIDFAKESEVMESYHEMIKGSLFNITEQRPVLHMALRAPEQDTILVNGENIIPEIHRVKEQMRVFSEAIRSGELCGYSGKRFTDIVNIGIGGSDLGPKMVCDALKAFSDRTLNIHFVSNIDPTHIAETLRTCSPETTLFIIASKTFTTEETLANAHAAKKWFEDNGGKEWENHSAALSANFTLTSAFGIKPEHVFVFWDWVGGRYSLWSAIGLSIAISIGYNNFEGLLKGARAMDEHMAQESIEHNLPILLGLIDVLNVHCYNIHSHAILPYDEYLRLFPAFLQQMIMESNGKYISRSGDEIAYRTSPIIWGEPGTDSQHSFFQLLHQGTENINSEFIVCARSHNPISDMHERLLANCAAQSAALMHGKNESEVMHEFSKTAMSEQDKKQLLPHKVFPGNRTSTTIMLKELNPYTLGWLIALFEHRTFVQGVLWNICSYDQWGVELGKQLAKHILPSIKTLKENIETNDCSTDNFIRALHSFSKR